MIINALRYRTAQQHDWKILRFHAGRGLQRPIFFFNQQEPSVISKEKKSSPEVILSQHGSHSEPKINAVLSYALFGTTGAAGHSFHHDKSLETSVQVSDDAGDTWVIHRTGSQVKLLKNGELCESPVNFAVFLSSLANPEAKDHTFKMTYQDLTIKDGKIKATPRLPATSNRSLSQAEVSFTHINGEIQRLINALRQQLKIPTNIGYRELSRGLQTIDGLRQLILPVSQFLASSSMKKLLQGDKDKSASNNDSHGSTTAIQELNKLKTDLALTEKIQDLLAPMIEPASTYQKILDQFQHLKMEATRLDAAHGCDVLALQQDPQLWRKTLEALSRLEAHEKLLKASGAALKLCEGRLEPAYKHYLNHIEETLSGEKQITSELEHCLRALHAVLADATVVSTSDKKKWPVSSDSQPGNQAGGTWFDKVKSHLNEFTERNAKATTKSLETSREKSEIETARFAIEYTMQRLSQFSEDIAVAKDQHATTFQAIQQAHQLLLNQYDELKSHWLNLAKKLNLSEDYTVPQLLQLIMNYGPLQLLQGEHHVLQSRLSDYDRRIEELKELVLRWRDATQSQKQTSFSSVNLVLNEAKEIVRYAEVKKSRLHKLMSEAQSQRLRSDISDVTRQHLSGLHREWSAALKELHISEEWRVDDPRWNQIIKTYHLLSGLAYAQAGGAAVFNKTWAIESSGCSIHVLELDQTFGSPSSLELLESYLTANVGTNPHAQLICATPSSDLLMGAKALGMGYVQPATTVSSTNAAKQANIASANQATPAQAPTKARTPVLRTPRPVTAPSTETQANTRSAHSQSSLMDLLNPEPSMKHTKKPSLLNEQARRTLDLLQGKPRA